MTAAKQQNTGNKKFTMTVTQKYKITTKIKI